VADHVKANASRVQSEQFEKSPAKVPGDRDEAKSLPDDIVENVTGGPDADLHHPAAANSVADSEAGEGGSEGRIQPLQGKRPTSRPGAGN
jgi:hypothetical protein